MFAGQVKIVSHSSCRTSAILKYLSPEMGKKIFTILLKIFFLSGPMLYISENYHLKAKPKSLNKDIFPTLPKLIN